MLRLLQGDVGSGKTSWRCCRPRPSSRRTAGGADGATEILARQHYSTIAPLGRTAGIEVAILTGASAAANADIIERLGSATSTSWSARTRCSRTTWISRPRLAIVDEQHRFGVHQRLALARRAKPSTCW
jgi:ATP-dependent DNA helicase RecG